MRMRKTRGKGPDPRGEGGISLPTGPVARRPIPPPLQVPPEEADNRPPRMLPLVLHIDTHNSQPLAFLVFLSSVIIVVVIFERFW